MNIKPIKKPALLIAAPSSGQGKTAITAGMARGLVSQGRRVAVFKLGPDFLDPQILTAASGNTVYQLDPWMMGMHTCRQLLYRQAQKTDVILVESAMGLFDGNPCAAELAKQLDLPVLLVVDASRMAQTFAAVASGLLQFDGALSFAGVVANRVASQRHKQLILEKCPKSLELLAIIERDSESQLPSRHLGLMQAEEINDLQTRLDRMGQNIVASGLLTRDFPPTVEFFPPDQTTALPRLLKARKIGIAKDQAFAFIYPQNLEILEEMGASLEYFSPMTCASLPAVDALYLPGGYPELHLSALSQNTSLMDDIRRHFRDHLPMVAECGGLLYCLSSLADGQGRRQPMLDLLPGHGKLQSRLVGLGMQFIDLPQGQIRGHTFHHCRIEKAPQPAFFARWQHAPDESGEAIYQNNALFASFVHMHFASHPQAVAGLFQAN